MPEIKNNFLQGKMNKDLDDRLLPNGQYRDATNVKISKSENSDVGTVQNIKGNDYLYSLPINAGTNVETIGYYKNDLTEEIFWFVTNFTGSTSDSSEASNYYAGSSAICKIYYFKVGVSSAPQELINSFRLNFSKLHPILHINLMDDLLFWTDNYNQPRRINLQLAKTNYYTNDSYLEDKISVAQYAPYSAPKVIMANDTSIQSLHIRDKFVKFAYRFQYQNNEYSLISPFTQTCFHPGKGKNFNYGAYSAGQAGLLTSTDESNAVKRTTVEPMQNLANKVYLHIDLPSSINKDNTGAANANGIISGNANTAHNIDQLNGKIANNDLLITERGDVYTVASSTSSTVTISEAISEPIPDNTRLYFYNNITSYNNPLDIKKIEILYAESDSAAIKVVDIIELDQNTNYTYRAQRISGNTAKLTYCYEYVYNSTKPIKTLPEADLIRVADVIPVKAKTQEISGNRVIYGNFRQNRSLNNAIERSNFSVTNGDQGTFNGQYLLSSVKSNREYSVGLVLSDRYGRQSTVFLPNTSTTFVQPKTGTVTDTSTPANNWTHKALKIDFENLIGDVYNADTNPLGWYSYKVVVKQSELEYYNVYAPSIKDEVPSGNTRSWLVLHGDNINKVPRDVTDLNVETGTVGSQTQLLPKILDIDGTRTQQSSDDFVNVISIGTKTEQGTPTTAIYLNSNNPLLAELPNGFGSNTSATDNLVVLETEPFKSALDIYYETSTAGLISHLNASISTDIGSLPQNITFSSLVFNESMDIGDKVADLSATNTSGTELSNESYSIISIVDGNGTNRAGAFSIVNKELRTADYFEFTDTNTDDYIIRMQVTDSSGNTKAENKNISLANSAPVLNTGTTLAITASTNSGTAIKTITATNGSFVHNNNQNTTNGLTFAITSVTKSNVTQTSYPFALNSSTGVLTTTGTVTAGDTWVLTITVTDSGGLTDNTPTLTISVTALNNLVEFWRSVGNTSQSGVCNDAIQVRAWHDGNAVTPSDGDKVYTSNQGGNANLFAGGGEFYSFNDQPDDGTGIHIFGNISNAGVVSNTNLCSQ